MSRLPIDTTFDVAYALHLARGAFRAGLPKKSPSSAQPSILTQLVGEFYEAHHPTTIRSEPYSRRGPQLLSTESSRALG